MPTIPAAIDSHIRVRAVDLPEGVAQQIMDALTLDNIAKEKALEQHDYGAERLPDEILLYEFQGTELVLPRGFINQFLQGLAVHGVEPDWDNKILSRRMSPFITKSLREIELREDQEPAVAAILQHCQGIVKAPPGAGKTVIVLEAIRQAGEHSLVITNKKHIAAQWQDRCEQHLGWRPGFIGDGEWDEKPVTIALQQTLHRQASRLDKSGWWSNWGFVCLDECHAVQAETYQAVIEKFPAYYRIGVSATPGKTGDFRISKAVLGPIIHETTKMDLREVGVLVKPEVIYIPTKFGAAYRGTEVKDSGYVSRNNYDDVVKKLVEDPHRNALISCVMEEQIGNCVLVPTRSLDQVYRLASMAPIMGWDEDRVFEMTGREKLPERMRIYAEADKGNAIIFSTVAEEAVDIPRLDRLLLVYPIKNLDGVRQLIGRIERPHPDKKDALVIDFADLNVGPLEKQFKTRKREVYRQEALTITKRKASDVEEASEQRQIEFWNNATGVSA